MAGEIDVLQDSQNIASPIAGTSFFNLDQYVTEKSLWEPIASVISG